MPIFKTLFLVQNNYINLCLRDVNTQWLFCSEKQVSNGGFYDFRYAIYIFDITQLGEYNYLRLELCVVVGGGIFSIKGI